ncbi:MAG: DUF362 domain-containing protein [Pseudomonadota bacterium]
MSELIFLKWNENKRLSELIDRVMPLLKLQKGELLPIKLHFGEEGNKGYIRPELVRPFISACKKYKALPFLTDTNTIYRGRRDNAVTHLMLAAGHGFVEQKINAPVIIGDGLYGDDHRRIEIDKKHFHTVKIATSIAESDVMIVLSHFKGHLLTGFGGAVKNLGMGCGSKVGKYEMHSGAFPSVDQEKCCSCGKCIDGCPAKSLTLLDAGISLDPDKCIGCGECVAHCSTGALSINWNASASAVQERLVEYAFGAVKEKRVVYFNFINHITANCDCLAKDEATLTEDIGILAGTDPVAIDQASYDLVCKSAKKDVFKEAHPEIDSLLQLVYAEEIGLGSRKYNIVNC